MTGSESTRFNFLVPAESDADLAELMTRDVDRDWALFGRGVYCWTLQTYLVLKQRGLRVTCSRGGYEQGCVNLGHPECVDGLRPAPDTFLVYLQAEYRPLARAQLRVVQNRTQLRGARTYWLPNWTQPGLIGRDASRNSVACVAYAGRPMWCAGAEDEWRRELDQLGLSFKTLGKTTWNDLSGVDVLLGLRSFDGDRHDNKPPTKLLNAWLAGIPLVAGPDSAYAQVGVAGEDYIAVTTKAEALAAIRRLKEDPDQYRRIVSRGRERAREFTREKIAGMWEEFLRSTATPAFEAWSSMGWPGRAWHHASMLWDGAGSVLRRRAKALLRSGRGEEHRTV